MFTTAIDFLPSQFSIYWDLFFLNIDNTILLLEKDKVFFQNVASALAFVVVILFIVVYLLRRNIIRLKKTQVPEEKTSYKILKTKAKKEKVKPAPLPPVQSTGLVHPQKLPDPGLIFKYLVTQKDNYEKLITLGQTEGAIKTYSTEIIDNHLQIYIRIMQDRDRDIYNLPGQIKERYIIDLRRDGKTMFFYPGQKAYQEMSSRMKVYIQEKEEDVDPDDLVFTDLDARNPLRFRIGDRLNQEGKFANGFFEFHLFTKDYQVKTKAGIVKIEKAFFVRLYKIYPGYDTGRPTEEGLFPMIDPFTSV